MNIFARKNHRGFRLWLFGLSFACLFAWALGTSGCTPDGLGGPAVGGATTNGGFKRILVAVRKFFSNEERLEQIQGGPDDKKYVLVSSDGKDLGFFLLRSIIDFSTTGDKVFVGSLQGGGQVPYPLASRTQVNAS